MEYQFPCPFCFTLNDINNIQCTACHKELSRAINVKYASVPEEVAALDARYENASAELTNTGLSPEQHYFEECILTNGRAVINMNFDFLWEWLIHGNADYQAYRRLVIQGDRSRKKFAEDRMRSVVEALLFGSHDDIIYGALSVDDQGLPSYGDVSVVIKTGLIDKVTSLLDENSYNFTKKITGAGWFLGEPIPLGHVATWPLRHKLAVSKCYKGIKTPISNEDIASLIMVPGTIKSEDEFIELYIYGKISKSMVEQITFPVDLRNKLKDDQVDQYDELKSLYTVVEY